MKRLFFILALWGLFLLVGCTEAKWMTREVTNEMNGEEAVYVTVDINPSLAFTVNRYHQVLSIDALNEDGEILLANLSFDQPELEEAAQLLIDEAIALGFIDADEKEVTIEIDSVGKADGLREQIRARVKETFEQSLEKRHLNHRVRDKNYHSAWLEEAKALGIAPGHYRLMQHAMLVDPELTLEEALEMSVEELIALIHEKKKEEKAIVASLMEAFLEEKKQLHDTYLPQIQELIKQIREAIKEGKDTEALEQALQALQDQMKNELQALIEDYQSRSEHVQKTLKMRYEERLRHHQQQFEAYLQRFDIDRKLWRKWRKWHLLDPLDEGDTTSTEAVKEE